MLKDITMFEDLVGETITDIKFGVMYDGHGSAFIPQETSSIAMNINQEWFVLHHEQDCGETVYVEDIVGDIDDIINSPILSASEVIKKEGYNDDLDSTTWTFYKIATRKGDVHIRWFGESNGHYSEEVDFDKVEGELTMLKDNK